MPAAQWDGISTIAKDFIFKTILVDPSLRMNLEAALSHPWIKKHTSQTSRKIDPSIITSLCKGSKLNGIQRHILKILSSILHTDKKVHIRTAFITFDQKFNGTIS